MRANFGTGRKVSDFKPVRPLKHRQTGQFAEPMCKR
jgi:hypothetical protein